MDVSVVLTLAVSLFFILDPFASIPMFVSVTRGLDENIKKSYANKAVIVAAILLFVFMFVGSDLMGIFGVTMSSFRVAGGIILLMMGVDIVFGLKLSKPGEDRGAAWVIIATPILTGPGVITASVLFSNQYGVFPVILAGLIALLITWMILRGSTTIMRIVGEQTLDIVSKVIGLLIVAMGVEYMFKGVSEWIHLYAPDLISTVIATMM